MPLSDEQIRLLNPQINRMSPARLEQYVENGEIDAVDLEKLTSINPELKAHLLGIINKPRPSAEEQQEWAAILSGLSQPNNGTIVTMLNNYIAKWSLSLPLGNHVNEAKAEVTRRTAAQEISDWEALDKQNTQTLVGHLKKYPATPHLLEIDDLLFAAVSADSSQVGLYTQYFPNGRHATEIRNIASLQEEWAKIVSNPILEEVKQFLDRHPYHTGAQQKLQELKIEEITRMKTQQSNYPIEDLFYYLKTKIFTDEELISEGVATPYSLDILRRLDEIKDGLPDINEEIRKCRKECAPGHTDVFLFGIPSTGKTCILMGLIGSSSINVSTVRAGGPYSCALQQYLEAGLTIGQTPKDFVATIEAEIYDQQSTHLINLVEMAGEDFAFKIADNENGIISFEDIGAGATQLLCNDNRKVFFIIVDPTALTVSFNHLVDETDQQGVTRTYLVRKNVSQKMILKRMVDLLSQPENKRILKNVDSIHIIVTKADVLGEGQEREKAAYETFMKEHKNIVQPLTRLCQEYGINAATNGVPMLYTFSLGSFYVGGIYQYNEADSNKLVEVLRGNTEATKDKSFWGKVRNTLN